MPLMDEFKEERKRIKDAPPKQKLAYFWEYYKWYVIVPALILIALTSYIYHIVTRTEDVVNGQLLNARAENAQTIANDLAAAFSEEIDLDTKEYSVNLNTALVYLPSTAASSGAANYESVQALMTWVAAGTIDFISGDTASLNELAYREYFFDLREILSEEQIAAYEPYFLYIDQAVIEAMGKAADANADVSAITFPDCRDPKAMEKPIPVMIDISGSKAFSDIYSGTDSIAFGIVANTKHPDTTLRFLDYIMK